MNRHAARIILVAVTAAGAALAVVSGGNEASPPMAPVPSLDAPVTEKLWRRLVRSHTRAPSALQACAATTSVSFYAATDWLRLTTTLAATPAPCSEVYVSVPPLAADKTQLRSDQAWRIRALGASFHALAEISYTGWSTWVASRAGTWYDAGVEARRRMAGAGFDVAAGDRWALNELSSAVRAGTGNARANVQELLRGLHDGPPGAPAVRGVAFVAGIGQRTSELSVYQARLQDWLEDGTFWQAMSGYVDDWAQEQYGDVRAYAVSGADLETRRARLADYLAHDRLLALAEPGSAAVARAFLASAQAPVANAAWRFDASFGWTDVSIDLMEDYVLAQVDALRTLGAAARHTIRVRAADRAGNRDATPASLTWLAGTARQRQTAVTSAR